MEHPSATELRKAMDVLLELGELRRLEDYPARVAALLRRLIGCEMSSYTAVDPASGRTTVTVDPGGTIAGADLEVFARFAMQNPLIEHYAHTGDGRALRISDFFTHRQLHATELYHHVYRGTETEYQMAVTLPSINAGLHSQEMIGLTLGRAQRDFTLREQALADLMRPHFRATLQRLHEVALMDALRSGQEGDEGWALLADGDGTIALSTPAAARDLGFEVGAGLPPRLHDWISQERSRRRHGRSDSEMAAVTTFEIAGRALRARLRVSGYEGLDALYLTPQSASPRPEDLLALGLTRRQAEVLGFALEGLTSPQIARAMTLSTRTIEKHFEAIYARLGVSGRSHAIVHTLRATATR
jgi:DNA-binding CsgD family transcriptional regulator